MVGLLKLFVAGGDGPMLLEAIDGALDDVALPVRLPVEAHPALGLVSAARNDGADPATAQVGTHGTTGIALVADDAARAAAGTASAHASDRPALQQGRRLRGLVA